ncbi:MAG TPA: hypothetical protein VH496_15015 [Mycobacterium sp.]
MNAASNGNDFKLVVDSTGTRVVSQHQEPQPSDDVAKLQGTQSEYEVDAHTGAVTKR